MVDLEQQLRKLRSGKSKRLRGVTVRRNGESYEVDGDSLSLADALVRLNDLASTAAKSGPDYNKIALIEETPGSRRRIDIHRVKDRIEHNKLIVEVKKRHNYLWYAKVEKREDDYIAVPPFLIDWDTVPDKPYDSKPEAPPPPPDPKKWSGGLSCPFCRKIVTSTPGRTLHVKSEHPEKLQEYLEMLQKFLAVPKNKPIDESDVPDDDDDVISRVDESESSDVIKCPFCGKKLNSTPGRTNHVKGKHPDKLGEYQKMFST